MGFDFLSYNYEEGFLSYSIFCLIIMKIFCVSIFCGGDGFRFFVL